MTPTMAPCVLAVVEDDSFMAQLICEMLESGEIDVEVFPLGRDLLRQTDLPKYKTIILDLSLPDIDGFDQMDELASRHAGLSVLLMSGHSQATLAAAKLYGDGIGLNVIGTLQKPFSRDDLFTALGLEQ